MPKVVAPNVRFECLLCGKCCVDHPNRKRSVVLTEKDVRMIRNKTRMIPDNFCDRHPNHRPYLYIMRMKDGKCTFFGEDGRCKIYDARPLVCRTYPFSFKITEDSIIFQSDPECPGMGRGRYLGRNHFVEIVRAARERS